MRRLLLCAILLVSLSPFQSQASMKRRLLCSTYLMQPHRQMEVFNRGHQTPAGEYYAYQPPSAEQRVLLHGNFMTYQMVSDLVQPWATIERVDPEELISRSKIEWVLRKNDLLFSLNFGLMRGPMVDYEVDIYDPNFDANFSTFVLDPISKIIAPLYQSYAKQGPERAMLLPRIRRQDERESDRFVRFILSRFVKPMGYTQLLVSRNAKEHLHVLDQWGSQVADMIRSHPDEVVGELGRLHIVHPNEYQFDYHREQVTELTDEDGRLKTNRLITHLLLQKVFAWARSDARLDRLLIQINLPVEKVMKLNQIPLELGERRILKGQWKGQHIEEVVYAFDRSAIEALDRYFLKKVLMAWFEYAIPHRLNPFTGGVVLKMKPNELTALHEIGVLEAMFPKPPFQSYPVDLHEEIKLFVDIPTLQRGLNFLKSHKNL